MVGRSRNAVIGKVHRLGLSGNRPIRDKAAKAEGGKRKRKTPFNVVGGYKLSMFTGTFTGPEPKKRDPTHEEAVRPDDVDGIVRPASREVSLLALAADDCRWPEGDPLAVVGLFCGHPRAPGGSSYCPYHSKLAFTTHQVRERVHTRIAKGL